MINRNWRALSAVRTLAVGGAALCSPAFAQVTAPADTKLEEIVVTAERRETSAQTTPISMSVYTGDTLRQQGVNDIRSLTTIDPSVNITATQGTAYVAIRGITSTDLTEIGDPAVSIARDGFFANRPYTLFASFYDVERVEVLKGPQGTLYGRNSSGGVINIITARPSNEYGGYASLDVGSYNATSLEAAVNLPLNDAVQMRVSGVSLYHKGYRDVSPVFQRGDDEGSRSARAQLAVKPVEGVNLLLSAQRDAVDEIGDVESAGPLGEVYRTPDPSRFPNYQPSSLKLDSTRYRAELAVDLPFDMTLRYLGGVDLTTFFHAHDSTGLTPGAGLTRGGTLSQFLVDEHPTTQNHELRLASAPNERLFWQTGVFYFQEHNSPLDSGRTFRDGPYEGQHSIFFNYDVKAVSKAIFGQATFSVTSDLKVSAGARYTRDDKSRSGNSVLNLSIVFPGGPIIDTPGNGQISESKPTYHVGIDWTPTAGSLLYVKYDTGYKSGGFNSNGSAPSVDYGPETVAALELGSKNRFLNDALQLNVALFDERYQGYQASQVVPDLGNAPGVQNVGSARIYGAEAEFVGVVPKIVRAELSATYLHTRFGDVNVLDENGNPATITGSSLPNAPKTTVVAALQHETETSIGSFTGRLSGKYQSSINFSFLNYADNEQKAYTTGDFELIYKPTAAKWSMQAYVKNFSNTVYLLNAIRNPVNNDNAYEFAPPRTYGLKVVARW